MLVLVFSDAVFLHTRQNGIDSIRPFIDTNRTTVFSPEEKLHISIDTPKYICDLHIL